MASASHLERYFLSGTPSSYFYSLANNDSKATNYAEPLRDHGLKSDIDLQGLIPTGPCYQPTVEKLAIDLESDGPASVGFHLSSADSIQSFRQGVSFDAHGLPLSEPCSSLESGHGRSGQDASLVPRGAVPPRLPRLAEPPLWAAIRQVWSSDPSYAEDLIRALNQLPHDKHSLSVESEPEPEPADDPGSSEQPPKKRQKPSGNNSNGGGRAGRGTARGRSGQGAGDKDNRESQDGSGRGDRSRPARKVNMEKRRCWVCPYSVAYPHLRHNGMSKHCWPGKMITLCMWREHLAKHHSPIDPNVNPTPQGDVAQLHMSPEQWRNVRKEIEEEGKSRPRDQDEWFRHHKELFLKVWRIIFPQNQFPHLDEPSSPFLLNSDEITELELHAKVMLKSQRHVSANRAVESGAIASREDFRPSDAELDEMMSKAISAALLSSPVAFDATHRLARASSQTPQTTSTDDTDAVGPNPETTLQDVPSNTNTYTPTAAPRMSGPASIDLNAAQTTSTDPFTARLRLFPTGTEVTINFLPTNWYLQTDTQMGYLQASLPTSFYPTNFNQQPLPLPLTLVTSNGPTSPTPLATDLDPTLNPQPPTGPLESQGVSMQTIQGRLPGPEESAVMNHLG